MDRTQTKTSPRKLSDSTESNRRSTGGATTPTNKSPRKGSKQKTEEDDEDSGWTEANLRAQMKETDSSKELDLSHKCLDEIPPNVFRIKDIETLDISGNPELDTIPVDIASLPNLKEIKAAGCDIRNVSDNVSRCTYLSKVDFSRNPHIAALPATMKQLQYLKYLALCSCELKSLPKNLTLLAFIETLDLSGNVLTTLPIDISGLKRVKVLILNDNAFEIIPESIRLLGRLESLEMKRNKLNNNQSALKLNVPPRLKMLDMADNCSLGSIPEGIENLECIEGLNFSYCGIEALPNSIGQLSTLKQIYLPGNKLRSLPESFGRLINMETLDLEGNRRFSRLPLSLHHLRKMREKEKGTNTGLVLDNVPALEFPEQKIVKEGVVSVLTELLTEDTLNSFTVNIASEVVDDEIIEVLSEDIVTIVEGCLSKELVLDVLELAITEEGCMQDIFTSVFEDVISSLVNEVSEETVCEEKAIVLLIEELLEETKALMTKEVATSATALLVMEELMEEITMAMAKSIALELDEERRLGKSVPEEYDKHYSFTISAFANDVQSMDLPAGCNLSIPPGATDEDTSVISAVLNPHGYDGALDLGVEELLVSDIIEMRPAGMTFSKPVTLKIPHSLPKFDLERDFIVVTSEDDGRTWNTLKTLSHAKQLGHRYVTVEVSHFSSFAVVARPLEHSHRVKKGQASELRSSKQTGIEVLLPKDSVPGEEEISFKVTPVDDDALKCAGLKNSGVDSLSHIIKFFKSSNLLLNSPATIVLPLPSCGERASQARVLSCKKNGEWEDATSKVNNIVLQESKVAFKTDRLSAGFAVLRCDERVDATGIVNLVTKNVRARHVRTVIFKKWKEPREEGIMTARMECLLEESVEDRICRTLTDEKYELQEGTPTPAVAMVENETICAIFHGNIRPDVEMVNGMYGVNFTFYCERQRRLEFDVKVVDTRKDACSQVKLYPGPRENYHLLRPSEKVKPAAPLAIAAISAPTTNRETGIQLGRPRLTKSTGSRAVPSKRTVKGERGPPACTVTGDRQTFTASCIIPTFQVGSKGCTVKASGVTLEFPEGCVDETRSISVEVDCLPLSNDVETNFTAMSAVMTVEQAHPQQFLRPVTVRLPWVWTQRAGVVGKRTGTEAMVILHHNRQDGWTIFPTDIQEEDDGVVFQTSHFQSFFAAAVRAVCHRIVELFERLWKMYSEDKAYIIVSPNKVYFPEWNVNLLCVHKLDDPQDFFDSGHVQADHQVKQRIVMNSRETIKASLRKHSDLQLDRRDSRRLQDGIIFEYPPADRNRYSLRLEKTGRRADKLVNSGSFSFERQDLLGNTQSATAKEINDLPVYAYSQGILSSSTGVSKYFHYIKENVTAEWKDLAYQLGFSQPDLDNIEERNRDQKSRCLDMLWEWHKGTRKPVSVDVLMNALNDVNLMSVLDGLKNIH